MGPLTPDQMYKHPPPPLQHPREMFLRNPRFLGLKFPDMTRPETLEKRYLGKLSKKALSFMKALLAMDPSLRLTGPASLDHPYFEGLHNPVPQPQGGGAELHPPPQGRSERTPLQPAAKSRSNEENIPPPSRNSSRPKSPAKEEGVGPVGGGRDMGRQPQAAGRLYPNRTPPLTPPLGGGGGGHDGEGADEDPRPKTQTSDVFDKKKGGGSTGSGPKLSVPAGGAHFGGGGGHDEDMTSARKKDKKKRSTSPPLESTSHGGGGMTYLNYDNLKKNFHVSNVKKPYSALTNNSNRFLETPAAIRPT
jgi:serine/threonine protein kinase